MRKRIRWGRKDPNEAKRIAERREQSRQLVGKTFIIDGVVLKVSDVDSTTGECITKRGHKSVLYPPAKFAGLSPL